MLLYLFTFACLLASVECLVLSFSVYRLNKGDLAKRWMLLSISVAIWMLGLGFEVVSGDRLTALCWSRFYYSGVVFIPSTYFHFSLQLLNKVEKNRVMVRLGYVLSWIFLLLNFAGLLVKGVSPKSIFNFYSDAGLAYFSLIVFFFIYVGYAMILELISLVRRKGYDRTQILYIFCASVIAFSGGFCMFFPAFNLWSSSYFGIFILWIYPLLVAYSVATARLMDIGIFLQRTTRAAIGGTIFIFVLYVSNFTFQDFFKETFGAIWFIFPSLIFGIGLLCFVFFIKHVFRMNEEDLSRKFAYRPILKQIAKRTAKSKSREELFAFATRFISAYAGLTYLGILLLDQDQEKYTLIRSHSRSKQFSKQPVGQKIFRDNAIITFLCSNEKVQNIIRINFRLEQQLLPFSEKKELLTVKTQIDKLGVQLCVPCFSEGQLLAVFFLGEKLSKEVFLPKDEDLFLTVADQLAKPIHNFFYKRKAVEGFINSQEVVVRAVEAKDPYTRGHSDRVAEMSQVVGKELGLDQSELESLKYAARLHDIGKIAIKDSILNKPARLTYEEYEEIKQHPTESVKMVQPIASELGEEALDGILHHHENIDGTGYPDGLKGSEIRTFAKIIRGVDTLDALLSSRPYRKKPTFIDQVIDEFNRCSGTHFDPEITQIITDLCRDEQFISWLKALIANTGAICRLP
jgi:HD-GYP domain-containing protein (c-di-GMP phosphodiesterase class II)